MGRRRRDEITAAHFDRIIERTERVLDQSEGTEELDSFLHAQVRENRKLSLDERRTEQQIRESKHRISSDEKLLDYVDRQVVAGNFVRLADVRAAIAERLQQIGFPFWQQFVDMVLPEPKNTDLVDDLLDAWERRRNGSRDLDTEDEGEKR